jgi:serine-type D-Ala-D-Ala carboxypeptidase/endopeptidase (penicillin-binding protein 4)
MELFPSNRLARRSVIAGMAAVTGSVALGAHSRLASGLAHAAVQTTSDSRWPAQELPPDVQAIIGDARYRHSSWGIYAADRDDGSTIYDLNGDQQFIPGSTTKLWAAAAALDAYGPDYRFETPVYRTDQLDAQGQLHGDLILVASGDMTMGGRNTSDGHIDYTNIDHNDANAVGVATLTPEDPLAGLDDLARQVAAAGVRRVAGDVMIDARLYPQTPKDDYVLSPIMINDNLIDFTLTPTAVGQPAQLAWRPQTAAYHVQSQVQTAAAGQPVTVTAASPQPGVIVLQGQLPADKAQLVHTYTVLDPPSFARTLFIEALQRQNVAVGASATGANPTDHLPASGSYTTDRRVALLRSLPFSENIKLILKVSMNQQADTLIFLLALKQGKTSFSDGMQAILPFLQDAGLDTQAVALSDGRGNSDMDLFSPRVVTDLLRYMATRPEAEAYRAALPVLGVNGTEADTVPPYSPVRGKAVAKTGTVVKGDELHQQLFLMAEAMAGYMTSQSGRELVYSIFMNHLPIASVDDVFSENKKQGLIAQSIFSAT